MSKVSKLGIGIYVIIAVLTILAYISVRQELMYVKLGWIVISNLTVNYVVGSFITGGLAGWWVYDRLLKRAKMPIRLIGTVFFVLIVAVAWMILMAMGGYEIRWLQ